MGNTLFDHYTYLHFAVGIVCYFWDISLLNLCILHTIFELLENTPLGMNIINKYIPFWPGGKPESDSLLNSIGDTIGCIIGWLTAYYLHKLGKKYKWYKKRIY
jgi:hypothetical protein